jgi:hypothetical protein
LFDRTSTKSPIASFNVPPHPPPAAAAAIENFNRVADDWGRTRGEIADAKEAAQHAKAEAKAAVTEGAKSGKPSRINVVAVEQEHAAKIAGLEAKAEAQAVAVDETGNEMAIAIAENRAAWLTTLEEVAAEAEARYEKALKDAQAALAELAPARGAVDWLESFNHTHARIGTQTQFAGGRLTIQHRLPGTVQGEWDPQLLLAAAAVLVAR